MATSDGTLARRAGANLARGLGGSLPFALLPPLLARHLVGDEFAVWVLVVQFAGYVAYMELGVQTAVSKTVATAYATGGRHDTRGPIAAGVRLLSIAAAAGAALVAAVTILFPALFDIPDDLVGEARLALLVLGMAAAAALPGSAVHGALLGIGRNGTSAIVVVVSRLVSVSATVAGAFLGWSLPALALALASGTLVNAILPFVVARSIGLPVAPGGESPDDRREILQLTVTFGTFTVATLLITGIDVVVVGVVDFGSVAAYGLGASLVIVISAGYTMMFTVLLPAFADSAARGDEAEAKRLAVRSTHLSSWVLASGYVLAVAFEPLVMGLWAGAFSEEAGRVFLIVMAGGILRLSISPLAQFIVGFGDHQNVRAPAIAEALLNLALSITLGLAIGAIGVAMGTLAAAAAVLGYYLVKLAPAVLGRGATRQLLWSAYAGPAATLLVAVPLVLVRQPVLTIVVIVGVLGVSASRLRHLRA